MRSVASHAFGSTRSSPSTAILLKRKSPPSSIAPEMGSSLSGRESKSSRRRASATSSVCASDTSPCAPRRSRTMTLAAWPSSGDTAAKACGNFFWVVLTPWCPCSRRSSKSRCSALSACRLRFWRGTLAKRFAITPTARSLRWTSTATSFRRWQEPRATPHAPYMTPSSPLWPIHSGKLALSFTAVDATTARASTFFAPHATL